MKVIGPEDEGGQAAKNYGDRQALQLDSIWVQVPVVG
jgi:hypothetical protein